MPEFLKWRHSRARREGSGPICGSARIRQASLPEVIGREQQRFGDRGILTQHRALGHRRPGRNDSVRGEHRALGCQQPDGAHELQAVWKYCRWQRDICRIIRSEEHTSELQSLMRISYAVICLTKNTKTKI